jgi:anti-anti-sigma regulatory factor
MIQDAIAKVNSGESEVILDFSSVRRIDTNMVGALEELARLTGSSSAKVVLRAVNTDVYRVIKQLKLTQRFTFVT